MAKKSARTVKSKSKALKRAVRPILNPKDVPATHGMIHQLHKVIKADMKAMEKRIDARFSKVDARFNQMEARFNTLESQIQLILTEVHRIGLLVEEQNRRNAIVLEGYDQLYKRMDRHEHEVNHRLLAMESVIFKKPAEV